MNPRKSALLVGLVLATICMTHPATAPAAQTHSYKSSFGAQGVSAGDLRLNPVTSGGNNASSLAVSSSTGDVYVADTRNHRVDEFASTGAFLRAWGWGVANGASEFQVCTEQTTCQVGLEGSAPGQFEDPTFVAVDNDNLSPTYGAVYVADVGDGLVTKFSPTGTVEEAWGTHGQLDGSGSGPGAFEAPLRGIAVDGVGDLWVLAPSRTGWILYKFGSSGAFLEDRGPLNLAVSAAGLAVNTEGDSIFSANFGVVELSPSGGVLGFVSQAPRAAGITYDPVANGLYIDEGSSVEYVGGRCEPSELGCAPAQTFGSPELHEAAGLAVAPDGTVYVADAGTDEIAVFPVSLESTVSPATDLRATSATVNGKVDPRTGGKVTRCFFRLGRTTSYGQNLPCLDASGVEVGTGSNPIEGAGPTEVHADLSGLEGGSTYHFSLRAFNVAEEEVTSEDGSFETLPIPVISAAETKEVTASSATLTAKVDPEGLPVTSCLVQWGTSTAYGTTIPCEPPTLPAGPGALPISARLEGLAANTTYHWRVVATDHCNPGEPSEVCTATGPDNTFVFSTESPGSPTGTCSNEALRQANGSLALPDCRAYELVTPPQKNGALFAPVVFGLGPSLAADGSRLIASSLQCFGGAESCTGDRFSKGPPFEFSRTSSGWVATPLAPPASEFEINSIWGYSADSAGIIYSSPLSSKMGDEFYARHSAGATLPIGPIAEDNPQSFFRVSGVIATGDLSHVLFESSRLWSFDATTGAALYEYAGLGHSRPLLVGVEGGEGSTDLISTCGTSLTGENSPPPALAAQALSGDGHTVYFTAAGGQGCQGAGQNPGTPVPANEVWARIDGEGEDARSVDISERQCGGGASATERSCRESHTSDARFEGASEDGSRAYFSSDQQLTNEATEASRNLYLYSDPQEMPEPVGDHLIDVSAGDTSGLGPDVRGVMAVSADGSHVYYVASGVLAGQNGEGVSPVEGADNLYLYQRDAAFPSGQNSLVATLPGTPKTPNGETAEAAQWGGLGADVTAGGRFLVFTSHGALTSDAEQRAEAPAQVYRYDAQDEQLLRVSVGSAGFDDNGDAGSGEAQIVRPQSAIGPTRRDPSMSKDGSAIFFESPVGLTPAALDDISVNGRHESADYARNIYEWQAPGPACAEPSGCIALISDGRDVTEGNNGTGNTTASAVELLGTDTEGRNVFFSTTDPLVAADTDTGYDIYDARAGGGFAPAPAPTICQGDACKGQGTQASSGQGAATSTFSGAEEGPKRSAVTKCKKGFVRKGSRCVKKSKQKKKHHKSGSKHNGKHKRAGDDRGGGK